MEEKTKKFDFDLQISDNDIGKFDYVQKCYIPDELLPKGVLPGSCGKCYTNYSKCYLCRIYPMDTDYEDVVYCVLNRIVHKLEENKEKPKILHVDNFEYLQEIEIVPEIEAFESISVDVELTSLHRQINGRDILGTITRNLLQTYYLDTGFTIVFDDNKNNFGIAKIIVKSTNSPMPGCVSTRTNVTIDDVHFMDKESPHIHPLAGLERIKKQLEQIESDLKCRPDFKNTLIYPSFNTLLIGPSGCGKTSLVYEFVRSRKCNLFVMRYLNMIGSYPGETENSMRELVKTIKRFVHYLQPKCMTILLVENVEEICSNSSRSQDTTYADRVSHQFIALLDELNKERVDVLVFGTTDSIESVNLAVRRAGRFENEIYINVPDREERIEILKLLLSRVNLKVADEENCDELILSIAKKTQGFVGAELSLLVNKVRQEFKLQNVNSTSLEKVFEQQLRKITPSSIRDPDVNVVQSDVGLDTIGGMHQLKNELEMSILLPFKHPESYMRFGVKPPKGILLYGPPGCAKTTVARCLAKEANMTLITTSGAEVYSPYVGNSEKHIKKIFNKARLNMPCLIFFDEIDALVGTRMADSTNVVQTRVLSTLLMEMDGVGLKLHSSNPSESMTNVVLVIGATNRPDMVDDALLRPGRFDRVIYVPPPDRLSRYEILKLCKKRTPFSDEIDFQNIADMTKGFSGADLVNLCNEAALQAMTRDIYAKIVTSEDFETVFLKTQPSLSAEQIEFYQNFALNRRLK